ncbi:UNVERIFIED_CONTAM: hypothetical protein Sradi_6109400 [Sesamum radiatum]|uniref:Uncharacterized protein n=1 Tax=Sesamum radiatum TaxID=300843 RepID=A0AAW2KL45_SESRA
MHIEKNVFENIFNTVMDIKGKTKDNLDTRRDLKSICNRLELKLDERRSNVIPKVVYTLGNEQKKVCEWIRGLKFPDRYASNLACCVNMMELRMHGMKSYNCHVLQKLIPIAFRKMLPGHVWSALTKARRVVDDSKWTETGAYQPKEVVPVPIVAVDNQSYNLRDPNGVQVVLEAAGTSRR